MSPTNPRDSHTESSSTPLLTFILGCTGCGKGSLGRELAKRTGGEIISIDSMKVYRRMDVGTAKPSAAQRAEFRYHLIDVVEPSEEFSVGCYVELAERAIADIHGRGRPIFIVGGTPMYIKALGEGLFDGPPADAAIRERLRDEAVATGNTPLHDRLRRVDPSAADRIHVNDLRRIVRALEVFELTGTPLTEFQTQWDGRLRDRCVFFGLRRERADQNQRCNTRVRRMVDGGLVDEAKSLLAESEPLSETARKAVGYAEIFEYLAVGGSLAETIEKIKINTRRLAKSQRTWFKRFRQTEWIDLAADADMADVAYDLINRRGALWSA
ncbi:MAG: tRNA (adenosine(37)-N6)-dimethylallyltransferase MiaA [Planctomycetes bacterium]|nr:tRNA (adenosine(37)-N6)-dimethylallyltransferase MiaA [Planctomycetota bacterium]